MSPHADLVDCAFNNAGIAGWQVDAVGKRQRSGSIPAHPQSRRDRVVWLCSERASFLSGAAYNVNGGWRATQYLFIEKNRQRPMRR
jgi:hypothetical protein